jgi:hypothetical protein
MRYRADISSWLHLLALRTPILRQFILLTETKITSNDSQLSSVQTVIIGVVILVFGTAFIVGAFYLLGY